MGAALPKWVGVQQFKIEYSNEMKKQPLKTKCDTEITEGQLKNHHKIISISRKH